MGHTGKDTSMSIPDPQSAVSRPRFIDNARSLLRLAAPLILGQIAVVGMTVTDIYMAGQVDPDTLAALQLGGSTLAYTTHPKKRMRRTRQKPASFMANSSGQNEGDPSHDLPLDLLQIPPPTREPYRSCLFRRCDRGLVSWSYAMSSYSNFTNGALLMRLWRFDGSGDVVAKTQYFDDAVVMGEALIARDRDRGSNKDGKWFYLAVCESQCEVKAIFDSDLIKPVVG